MKDPTMSSITIDLPDTITIPLGRNSIYGTIDIDVERLPENALEYIWSYGLKQVLNDSMATKVDKDGNDLTADEIAQKAHDKLSALYEGIIRMRGEAVAADAYEAEAIREAKRHTIAWLSKNGLMKDIPKKTENRMMYALDRHMEAEGKEKVTEAEYLALFFATPKGQAIKALAIKTVDDRRALAADMDDLI